MTAQIKRLFARINALNVRERFLLFAVSVSILGGATDYFFITPLLDQQKALVAQLDQKSTDMDVQREKVNAEVLQRNLGRAAELAAGMRETKAELDAIDAEVASLSAANTDPVAMSALLNRVLKRSDKVTLVRVVQANTDVTPPPPIATGAVPPSRGAVDITLAGNYLDLVDYLVALEKSLPQSRWSAVRLKADAGSAQITVRILIGADV
jgi:MSHA biogenesis protein MshJ